MERELKKLEEYKKYMQLGPRYKICRRLGSDVFEKCATQKFALSQAKKERSSKGKRRGHLSTFASQLIDKQKVRFSYGLSEKQFSNYVKKATSTHGVTPSSKLYELLESRLDNVIYKMGLAATRRFARQLVSHGHITVNGVKNRVPSTAVKIGDKIAVREGSQKSVVFTDLDKKLKNHVAPKWMTFDPSLGVGVIKENPIPEQVGMLNSFNTILEFYSR